MSALDLAAIEARMDRIPDSDVVMVEKTQLRALLDVAANRAEPDSDLRETLVAAFGHLPNGWRAEPPYRATAAYLLSDLQAYVDGQVAAAREHETILCLADQPHEPHWFDIGDDVPLRCPGVEDR